jgi:hypothetical protein
MDELNLILHELIKQRPYGTQRYCLPLINHRSLEDANCLWDADTP